MTTVSLREEVKHDRDHARLSKCNISTRFRVANDGMHNITGVGGSPMAE